MLSLRMGSGAEMVLWYIIPRRFSLQPKRVTRYFSTFQRGPSSPTLTHCANVKCDPSQHGSRRHNTNGTNTKWTGWRYWFAIWKPLPLSVGLAVLAILQWRRIYRRSQGSDQVATTFEMTVYRCVPLRAMSRAWGWIAEQPLPVSLRPWLYTRYARTFGCDLTEAANDDLVSFRSLAEFFTRELRDGVRPIEPASVVSPADGRVLTLGRVTNDRVEQVKGVSYSLKSFLGEQSWLDVEDDAPSDYFKPKPQLQHSDPINESSDYQRSLLENPNHCLYHCVVYLAPGDYHRFHSPVPWTVKFRRHFEGELLSVNPRVAQWIPGLFTLNERALYVGRWKHGFFSLTAVGATNVGSIRVYCDKDLTTNERKWTRRHKGPSDVRLDAFEKAGQQFGEFRLGSTVVLLFEAPQNFRFSVRPGDKVKVGEALCAL